MGSQRKLNRARRNAQRQDGGRLVDFFGTPAIAKQVRNEDGTTSTKYTPLPLPIPAEGLDITDEETTT